MLRWLSPLLLLAALPAAAQGTEEMDNPCADKALACRHVETVRLQTPEGEDITVEANMDMPWVWDDNIILVPGDSVTVRMIADSRGLTPQLVRSGSASAATRPATGEIRFTMSPSDHGKQTLTVESQYPGMLDYAAVLGLLPPHPERTSVCTIQPGTPVYEVWEKPVFQISVMHFVPTTESGCKMLQWGQDPVLVKP